MKKYVFCDLDNTIIRHQSKTQEAEAIVVGLNEFAQPSTVMTRADQKLYQQALEFGEIIPTTGRSIAECWRLQALTTMFTGWAILNHGATILYNHQVDQSWLLKMQQVVLKTSQNTLGLYQQLLTTLDLNTITVRLHQEHSLPLYISVRTPREQPYFATQKILQAMLTRHHSAQDYMLLHTGRISSILPKAINKKDAVLEVIQRLKQISPIKTLGMGDSLTDLAFLQVCDQMLYPEESEIAQEIQSRGQV
jgi:HAD superfamily hydrolase (TIGR01484 family)